MEVVLFALVALVMFIVGGVVAALYLYHTGRLASPEQQALFRAKRDVSDTFRLAERNMRQYARRPW